MTLNFDRLFYNKFKIEFKDLKSLKFNTIFRCVEITKFQGILTGDH